MAKLYDAGAQQVAVVDIAAPQETIASALGNTGLQPRGPASFGASVKFGEPDCDLFGGELTLSTGAPQMDSIDVAVSLSRPRVGRGRGLTRVTVTTTVGSSEKVRFAQTSGSRFTAQQLSAAVARQITRLTAAPPSVAGPGD